jgi:hypothetical protein
VDTVHYLCYGLWTVYTILVLFAALHFMTRLPANHAGAS